MAQESWKLDKDETDCELFKPPSSSPAASPPPQSPPTIPCKLLPAVAVGTLKLKLTESPSTDPDPVESPKRIRFMNRCTSCQKKVGLAGFRCRCGDLFCARHRYSDAHDCSFDYKSAGREQIAKANPLVRAAKIIKI